MIAAEEILDYAESVRIDETRWLERHEGAMRKIMDGIESELWPIGLQMTINAVSGLNDAETYYSNRNDQIPTIATDLLAASWHDLRTITVNDIPRDRPDQPESVKKLAQIINKFILPMNGFKVPSEANVKAEVTKVYATGCSKAEMFFYYAHKQATTDINYKQPSLSVYYDQSKKPIIFKKCKEESSGLTLEPIDFYGSIIPPGSIVSIPHSDEGTLSKPTGRSKIGGNPVLTYEIGDKLLICPTRLSPWAYTRKLDRALFALSLDKDTGERVIDVERLKVVMGLDLNSFRSAATHIMDRCGLKLKAQAA